MNNPFMCNEVTEICFECIDDRGNLLLVGSDWEGFVILDERVVTQRDIERFASDYSNGYSDVGVVHTLDGEVLAILTEFDASSRLLYW